MSFFIVTSALVIAVLIFLAWYVWKLKGKLAIAEFDLDRSQMEVQALESEFVVLRNLPGSVFTGHGRWDAVVANAIANNDEPARRIAWGTEFEAHLRRQEARAELEAPAEEVIVNGPDLEARARPRESIIERAVEREGGVDIGTLGDLDLYDEKKKKKKAK